MLKGKKMMRMLMNLTGYIADVVFFAHAHWKLISIACFDDVGYSRALGVQTSRAIGKIQQTFCK